MYQFGYYLRPILRSILYIVKVLLMKANTLELKKYILGKAQENNMSLRQLATELGLSHSYLSDVLNGKRKLNIDLGNQIADYFNVQRVVLYQMAGWLDLSEDEEYVQRFKEYSRKNPEFEKFVKAVLDIKDEKERKRMLRLLRAGLDE